MIARWRLVSTAFATLFVMVIGSHARAGDIAKCEDAVAKNSRNVGNQEQKKNRKCIKDGSGDVDACIDAEGPKAAIKRGKLVDLFATGGKCEGVTAQVNSDPNDIADNTEQAAGDIIRHVFGDPVDGIVSGSKCLDKIGKRAGKKFDIELKAFRACVKDAAPLTQAEADACVAAGVNDAKAQSTVQPKLDADMTAQCDFTSPPPPPLGDGVCSGCGDPTSCATCIGDIVDCEACLAMNNSNNGTADCDVLDDGLVNNSCPPGVVVDCPLAAGEYTITEVAGGSLKVYTFMAFPFPPGGQIVQDVAAPTVPPACVHDTVVPFPGGFSAPNFCVPALGYTVSVTQTGCGVGQIDSNGGSDFKIEETNDTSSPLVCGLPHAGCAPGADASTQVNVTTGGGTATCAGSGLANMLLTVPVHTKTWQDNSGGTFGACSGDGVFNAGDMVISEFDQILDFTTDEAHASWSDLDPDGCFLAGGGPAGGQPLIKGQCLDLSLMTVRTVAAGGFGSTGLPNDGSFSTDLPNTVAFTGPFAGATCGSPPPLSFVPGTVTRCLP